MTSDQISDSESAEQRIATPKPLVEQNTATKSNSETLPPRNQREQESIVERLHREKMITRRAMLVKAGWAVPVILAGQISSVIAAGSRVHTDTLYHHTDICDGADGRTHLDSHTPGFAHSDDCEFGVHGDDFNPPHMDHFNPSGAPESPWTTESNALGFPLDAKNLDDRIP